MRQKALTYSSLWGSSYTLPCRQHDHNITDHVGDKSASATHEYHCTRVFTIFPQWRHSQDGQAIHQDHDPFHMYSKETLENRASMRKKNEKKRIWNVVVVKLWSWYGFQNLFERSVGSKVEDAHGPFPPFRVLSSCPLRTSSPRTSHRSFPPFCRERVEKRHIRGGNYYANCPNCADGREHAIPTSRANVVSLTFF